MNRVILIKYGELTTKKDNRKEFINILYKNLMDKLKTYDINIVKDYTRMFIEFNEQEVEEILDVVRHTFGIHAFKLAYKVNTNIDELQQNVLTLVKQQAFTTFKVDTKRSDKRFPINSMDFNNEVGGLILKNIPNKKVDVHHPDLLVGIEIRNDFAYISFNEEKGLGGYPVGVAGHGLLMLSGGIDSPVAGYLALKKGIRIDAIYFEAIPHTSIEARNKVISLTNKLLKYTNQINLYVVPITKLQEEIYKNVDSTYVITILRRMMYRIAEKVARRNKHLIILNGESIGQVASQTLTSIDVINSVVDIPIIRPVACMDKLEIIDIAKKIDTYETSILPYEDCCTIFVPKHPVINPQRNKAVAMENLFSYEDLMEESINNIMVISINNLKNKNELL